MFYVPAYQRGYRWGEAEVRRLLEDIWESRDRPYYLQPGVVKRYGDEWELVDGQQRLTTLFLIFRYMKREGLQSSGADYSLRYETRPGSADYLEQLGSAASIDSGSQYGSCCREGAPAMRSRSRFQRSPWRSSRRRARSARRGRLA
jgi:hypothetical protein